MQDAWVWCQNWRANVPERQPWSALQKQAIKTVTVGAFPGSGGQALNGEACLTNK